MSTTEPLAPSADDLLTRQREIYAQALGRVKGAIAAIGKAEKDQRTAREQAKQMTATAAAKVAATLADRDAAITLAYSLGMPASDIADAAGISPSSVSQIAGKAAKAEAAKATPAEKNGDATE